MKKRFYLFILSLLGFSGCSDKGDIYEMPLAYGVLMPDYVYKGELVDSEGNPIEGIEVGFGTNASRAVWLPSEDDGSFVIYFDKVRFDKYKIASFKDTDGEENGGYFLYKELDLEEAKITSTDENGTKICDLGKIELKSN